MNGEATPVEVGLLRPGDNRGRVSSSINKLTLCQPQKTSPCTTNATPSLAECVWQHDCCSAHRRTAQGELRTHNPGGKVEGAWQGDRQEKGVLLGEGIGAPSSDCEDLKGGGGFAKGKARRDVENIGEAEMYLRI